MTDIIKHLKQITSFFQPPMCPLERLILECGKNYVGKKRPRGLRKGRDRQCFQNATHLALNCPDLQYVEGYGVHDDLGIPLLHAWCVDEKGNVIDPTWRYPERSQYRGVVIPRETLIHELVRNKVYGMLDPGMVNLKLIEDLRGNR